MAADIIAIKAVLTSCLCVLIIFVPFCTFFFLDMVHDYPTLYVQHFYVPALNNPPTQSPNASIFIHLRFRRPVAYTRLRYEDLNLTLFYGFGRRSSPVASHALPGFDQAHKRTVHKRVVVEAPGLPWEDAFRKVSGGSAVVLAVEFVFKSKYWWCQQDPPRNCTWSEKVAVVAADVWVDGSGEKVEKKPIRLR